MATAILLLVGALLAVAGYGCGYAHALNELIDAQRDDDDLDWYRQARSEIRRLPEVTR